MKCYLTEQCFGCEVWMIFLSLCIVHCALRASYTERIDLSVCLVIFSECVFQTSNDVHWLMQAVPS